MVEESYFPTAYREPYRKLEFALTQWLIKFEEHTEENEELASMATRWLIRKDVHGRYSFNDEVHLFHIAPEISQIFQNTRNNVFFRYLPFKNIVIDCDIMINNKRFQGIAVTQMELTEVPEQLKLLREKLTEEEKKRLDTQLPTWFIVTLEYPDDVLGGKSTDDEKKKAQGHWFSLGNSKTKEEKKIEEFICNFIDFLDEPEVQRVVVASDKDHNEKRLRRGKPALLNTSHIRITGNLKEYVNSIRTGIEHHVSHKFWVRGFWRHYRSSFYKNKYGMKEFIKPHIRGKGLLIKKDYQVKEEIK